MDNNQLTARTEFAAAINQICNERGIPVQVVIDSIKSALIASFRKDYSTEAEAIDAENEALMPPIDPEADPETVEKPEPAIAVFADLDTATGEYKLFKGKPGDPVKEMTEITPPGFGRIAAMTAKQVIVQKIREAEKEAVIADYRSRLGTIANGMVLRLDGPSIIVDLSGGQSINRGQATMPAEEQVRSEYYRLNSRFSFLISRIAETVRGEAIIVSRADPKLVEGLFAREVPEVGSGAVVVRAIAREAGNRTKIAVASTQEGVDPVGSCVGQKGVRVQAVINELNGEKIDIIQFSEDLADFIKSALAPADGLKVELDQYGRAATVTVPHDQLSLAIGRGGQNVRLAAKLVGVSIKIKSDQTDPGIVVTGDEEFEIDQLGLDTKVRNLLVEAKLTKIEDLAADPAKLEPVKGIGPKSLAQIKSQLSAYKPQETPSEKS